MPLGLACVWKVIRELENKTIFKQEALFGNCFLKRIPIFPKNEEIKKERNGNINFQNQKEFLLRKRRKKGFVWFLFFENYSCEQFF